MRRARRHVELIGGAVEARPEPSVGGMVGAMAIDHPLGAALLAAAEGRFPPVDGLAELVSLDPAGTCAVVCFTGHAFVLSDRPAGELAAFAPDGFGAALDPRLLVHLAGGAGAIGSIDVVMVRRGTGGGSSLVECADLEDHPRVRRSRHHRRDVRVLGDERGLVTIGRGLVDRIEISVELTGAGHGAGAGRALIADGLAGLGRDELVFAQVAPGNAASLRTFLACGFVPVASEVLIEAA
jgi:RimJ/RimL family protein N-acetyltransferase